MGENIIPEKDRRKKEPGIIQFVIEVLIGKQSRKVAFGIWVFAVANGMKERHPDMPWDLWWYCVLLAGALIGLGTILDEIFADFGKTISSFLANKFKAVVETTTTETTTVEEVKP